ncbi:MAG: 4-hydroxy-3-methylbut-2-enyl diphosphate reductase [Lachnospiraceae bacterium]|nr:4-hydroxy-3-methylbut-2-enyl diphosphate reductase [Lachnospiraceae bacterium]
MQVTVAKSAGFCFGVKRAVDMAYTEAANGGRVYTLGPLIHNEQVVSDMERRGVNVVEDIDSIEEGEDVTIVIRSHGISKETAMKLKEKNVNIVDATCPFVSKIHHIVEEKSSEGYHIIVTGDAKHPEVQGVCGWCNNCADIIGSVEEAEKYSNNKEQKICVVSQTTFNYKKFQDIVDILVKKRYDILVMNTICNATEERQTEAGTIARQSDAMLVIGGKHSSNTQKLFEICKGVCPDTYFIQTLDDLDLKKLQSFRSVGITAGASTPNNIIKEVQSYVRSEQ